MGSMMKEFWLFLPAKFKEKVLVILIIIFLLLILIFFAGYFFGIDYGISLANANCDELLERCLII